MRNEWKYTRTDPEEVVIREIEIDSGKGGEEAVIVQLTDVHFNAYTENDLKDPVLASTIEYRKWNAGGATVSRLERCFAYAESVGADQVVITGDVLDFFSEGCMLLMKEHIWDKHPDTIVSLGNHEPVKKVQGKVDDHEPLDAKLEVLQKNWNHDISYFSKVIKEKAMVIQLDNTSGYDFGHKGFYSHQVEPLKADLDRARANGYKVMLFYHDPINIGVSDAQPIPATRIGDKNSVCRSFHNLPICAEQDGADGEVYKLIVNNADIIAGCFCGHYHSDFYTEIKAKTADGEDTVIPQYVLMGVPYGKGQAFKITVK